MPRRRSSPRSRGVASETGKYMLAAVLMLFALSAGGVLVYYSITVKSPPRLDQTSYCPLDGPQSILVILIDTSDPLPDPAAKEVKTNLFDTADTLEPYGLLEIRVLDAGGTGHVIFSRCNPGDGADLNEFTGNPAMARKRWKEAFRTPLETVLEHGLEPTPSKISPIMRTIQNIAIERFAGRANESKRKRLVVVSDLLEHTADYSQYNGNLSFDRYRKSSAFLKFRTDLHEAEITFLMIQRKAMRGNSADLIRFWRDWVTDNNARFKLAIKLQGVE